METLIWVLSPMLFLTFSVHGFFRCCVWCCRTRAGFSRGDQFYASYPAGTELLTDTAKLYKAALGNCFENEEWGPIEYCIMAKHFERQGKTPSVPCPIHGTPSVSWTACWKWIEDISSRLPDYEWKNLIPYILKLKVAPW